MGRKLESGDGGIVESVTADLDRKHNSPCKIIASNDSWVNLDVTTG